MVVEAVAARPRPPRLVAGTAGAPVTACQAPRHDNDPPQAEAHATLCKSCRLDLRRDLALLPELARNLTDATTATGCGDGTGLPYNDAAWEARDQIRHDLTYWTLHVAGLRHWPRPEPVIAAMAGWLRPQAAWCTFRGWAPDYAAAIREDRRRAAAILDPWITRSFEIRGPLGACLLCESGRYWATFYEFGSDRRRSNVTCGGCGMVYPPEMWIGLGKRILRREGIAA